VRAFVEKDCSLAEVNPLVVTKSGDLIALDGKMNFDDNGLSRQEDVQGLRDLDEEDPTEVEAGSFGLSYVNLDGDIGCLVNGAGLAMATMDIIKLHGGRPKNFLDVGGGASKDQVAAAFRIILKDPEVKAILVNIFGGILRCTTLANGIVEAVRSTALRVPLVVRLEGTEVEEGRRILASSGLGIITGSDMTDAALKVVAAAGGGAQAGHRGVRS
jgi:succinyl-CoA synthetase beta subunit